METCNTDIKIEVDDDDSEDNNNSEQITRLEQPLALIKRKERDITERFPYIEEVTTTTPSRYRSISKFMPSKRRALACKIYKCIKINTGCLLRGVPEVLSNISLVFGDRAWYFT